MSDWREGHSTPSGDQTSRWDFRGIFGGGQALHRSDVQGPQIVGPPEGAAGPPEASCCVCLETFAEHELVSEWPHFGHRAHAQCSFHYLRSWRQPIPGGCGPRWRLSSRCNVLQEDMSSCRTSMPSRHAPRDGVATKRRLGFMLACRRALYRQRRAVCTLQAQRMRLFTITPTACTPERMPLHRPSLARLSLYAIPDVEDHQISPICTTGGWFGHRRQYATLPTQGSRAGQSSGSAARAVRQWT